VRGEGGCIANGDCGQITINPIPSTTITFTEMHGESCLPGGSGTVAISNVSGGYPGSIGYTYTLTGTAFLEENQTGLFAVLVAGTYTATVSDSSGCPNASAPLLISIIQLTPNQCLIPDAEPPASGTTNEPVGTIIVQIIQDTTIVTDTIANPGNSFETAQGSVLIDVIAVEGQRSVLEALLQTPAYGMTDLLENGEDTLTITGWYPVGNLDLLIPLYPSIMQFSDVNRRPLRNSASQGLTFTQGDIAMKSDDT
jgi:hypothetical protein